MNWEAIGTIAEVVGATAVVLSLIYVATQIKLNTAASRAQSINQINSQYGALMSHIAMNGDLAQIYRKATDGEELAPMLTSVYLYVPECQFAQHETQTFQSHKHWPQQLTWSIPMEYAAESSSSTQSTISRSKEVKE